MLNVVGGGNTPRVGEEYYRVPPCKGLARKNFEPPTKALNTLV
jgi:hypothetical protein